MGVVRAQNLPLRVVCQDYAVVYFASQQLPLSFGKLHDEEPLVALQELQSFLQHLFSAADVGRHAAVQVYTLMKMTCVQVYTLMKILLGRVMSTSCLKRLLLV